MTKYLRTMAWICMGVLLGMLVYTAWPSAHALPEYSTRTGQQCATCHVNPAGGGPRTLRGLLWLAQDRPDQIPPLPGSEEGGDETELDGATLYETFECSRCHGPTGGGDVGPALNQAEVPTNELTQIIRDGIGIMKGYRLEVMSDEELDVVVQWVQAIGRGEIQATIILQKRLLPPAQFSCETDPSSLPARTDCGGN